MKDELKHYGVLGMKWGVRRYQNKDGSLTKDGENRIRESGTLNFPAYDRKRRKYIGQTQNRKAAIKQYNDPEYTKTVERERDRIMNDRSTLKKAGYKFSKNPDSDIREHNSDIVTSLLLESVVVKEARLKSIQKQIDQYADATLADLKMKNTEQAKSFVKKHLEDNSSEYSRLFEELNKQTK